MGFASFLSDRLNPAIGTAGGIAGILGALFGPSREELASERTKEGAVDVKNALNAKLASAYNFDPNFAARNMMEAKKMAFLLGNKNMQGESAADRDPNLQRLLESLNNPNSQRLYENASGGFDFRPFDMNPAYLDNKGNMVNGQAPIFQMPGAQAPPPVPQVQPTKKPFDFGDF